MIELNLDISDIEKDIEIQKQIEKDLKIEEIKKKEYFKKLSDIYQERLELVLTYAKS